MEPLRHCAYNQTSDRLLGIEVAAADFNGAALEERMSALGPNSGTGLWMVPFRGLPPVAPPLPLDLLYLDERGSVLSLVESYPNEQQQNSAQPAASVLALPAGSIAASNTRPGDHLLICSAEELKAQIRQVAPQPPPRPRAVAAPPEAAVAGKEAKSKSWWQKLLNPDPPDKRHALRETIPGLIAYYWTGGASTPNQVRDISSSGLYLVTNERWYPGTVVRMTLTLQDGGAERSIAVQTRAVRWGNDGVGLEFVLAEPHDASRGEWMAPDGANRRQFAEFLSRIRR